jgi:hypothetical protein
MTEQKRGSVGIDGWRGWLPILTAVVSFAIAWGVFTTRISTLEEKVTRLTVKIEQYDVTLTDIKVQLAGIGRDVLYLRDLLDPHIAQPAIP